MSLVRNSDAPAVLFRDCPDYLSLEAKMVWASMADCDSSRYNNFCYQGIDSLRCKLGNTDINTKLRKPMGKDRFKSATMELECYGIIKHHGSWGNGTKYKSNVYWVSTFGVIGCSSPLWKKTIYLLGIGEVELSLPRQHKHWKRSKNSKVVVQTKAGNQPKVLSVDKDVPMLQSTTTYFVNPSTNCLIRERVNNNNNLSKLEFEIPIASLDEKIPFWKRVNDFLEANGVECVFSIDEWWNYKESLGYKLYDSISDWHIHVWSLAKAKKKAKEVIEITV